MELFEFGMIEFIVWGLTLAVFCSRGLFKDVSSIFFCVYFPLAVRTDGHSPGNKRVILFIRGAPLVGEP